MICLWCGKVVGEQGQVVRFGLPYNMDCLLVFCGTCFEKYCEECLRRTRKRLVIVPGA